MAPPNKRMRNNFPPTIMDRNSFVMPSPSVREFEPRVGANEEDMFDEGEPVNEVDQLIVVNIYTV